MPAIQPGRVCLKTAGRDACKKCVVTKILDDNFVQVASAGRKKERKCNILHLEPLPESVDASDAEAVKKALS
jgi:large subunit ribosomal protein L14e